MKQITRFFTGLLLLIGFAGFAQPVIGLTSFSVSGTISWNTNSPCVATKTADVSGWLVSVNSTSNCGINQSNSSGGDGRLQYLVGFGTMTQLTFGSDDGSNFSLSNIGISVSTSSWASIPMTYVGYSNGTPVSGATLIANSPSSIGNTNSITVTFTSNTNFNNVDEIRITSTSTCSSIFALEGITIATASVPCISTTLALASSSNVSCNGGSNGSATVSASGSGPFTYAWSPSGGSAASASGLSAGNYTCTATNSCGIATTQTVAISQPSTLSTAMTTQSVLCNGGSTGAVTVTASGGTLPYNYLWSTGSTASVISTQTVGVKTVTVTDAHSCSSVRSATIVQPSALVTTSTVANTSCNGGSNGSATVTSSGGTASYSYSWSTGATSSVVTGLSAGAYSVVVTDANSCTASKSFSVSQPSALVSSTAVTNASCNGSSNGSATVTASGGTGAYTYSWSTGSTVSAVSGLAAGSYTSIVKDANLCTVTKPVSISQPSSAVSASSAVTNVLCNGGTTGSATLTASGGTGAYTYSWSSGATGSVVTGLAYGSYTAIVKDASLCANTATISISQPPAVTVTAVAASNSVCPGNSTTVTASGSGGIGAFTYSWTTGSGGASILVTPTVSIIYSVIATDANACGRTATVSVNIAPNPVIAINSGSICMSGSFTLIPSGASTYTVSGGSLIVSPTVNSSYSVTGTSAFGCISSGPAVSTVVVNSLPAVSVIGGTLCAGNSFTLVPSGASTYTFVGGSSIVSPSITSTYSVSGTGPNGCVSDGYAVAEITVSAQPTITIGNSSICPGNSVTLTPTGAYTYTYLNGGPVVTPGSTSSYSITGTSSQGCAGSNTAVAVVTVSNTLIISITGSSVICSGNNASLTANGASTYTWNNGSTSPQIIVSPSVNTTYTVQGINGFCSNSAAITVTVNVTPTVSIIGTNSICASDNQTLTANGADTYIWNDGTTTASIAINVSATSNYSVTGTTLAGCSATAAKQVTSYPTPSVIISNGSICPGSSFTLSPSGAATYTYLNGGPVVSPTVTSSYSIIAASAAGCMATDTAVAVITVTNNLLVSISGSSIICSGESTTLTASSAASYTWNTSATSNSIVVTPSSSTTYSVYGINGTCTSTAAITITVNATPTISISGTSTICEGSSITLTATGADTYTWNTGSFNSTITDTPLNVTSYSVVGTSTSSGCFSSALSTVTVYALPTVSVNSGAVCTGNIFTITPSGAVTYTYSNGSSTVNPTSNSNYTVTGTSTAGCISSIGAVSQIIVNNLPNITVNSGTICSGQTFTLVPSGGVVYTYSNGTNTVNPNITTTYTVTGADLNGCVNTGTSTISVNSSPMLIITNGTICVGQSYTLSASGASTYTYSGGSSVVSPGSTTNYTISGGNAQGCVTEGTVSVSVNALPTISIANSSICLGQSYTFSPSGASTYTYSGGSAIVSPTVSSNYTISGTDSNGCSGSNTIIIVVNSLPVITISSTSNTLCAGETATLTASGATSFTWSPGSSFASALFVTPIATTNYTVTGSTLAGCSASSTFNQVVSLCTGLQMNTLANLELEIFPNPGTGIYSLKTNVSSAGKTLEVYSITGQLVHKQALESLPAEIDLTKLENGVYFIAISGENIISQKTKLIKQ